MSRTFRLYPEPKMWWSMEDYGALKDLAVDLRARTAIEFGPGSSTLSLVEAGVKRIDTYEDNAAWFTQHQINLAKFPNVTVHFYRRNEIHLIEGGERYDLAFVDGPEDTLLRPLEIAYALTRAKVVAVHDILYPHIEIALAAAGLPITRISDRIGYVTCSQS